MRPYATEPVRGRLKCEVHRHNDQRRKGGEHLRREVASLLEATGVFVVADGSDAPERLPVLRVVFSHAYDRGDRARAKAVHNLVTVPTLGAVGTHLESPVSVTIELDSPGGESISRSYPHEVQVFSGRHKPPEGHERVPAFEVHGKVVGDAMLQFLSEYRESHGPAPAQP